MRRMFLGMALGMGVGALFGAILSFGIKTYDRILRGTIADVGDLREWPPWTR